MKEEKEMNSTRLRCERKQCDYTWRSCMFCRFFVHSKRAKHETFMMYRRDIYTATSNEFRKLIVKIANKQGTDEKKEHCQN